MLPVSDRIVALAHVAGRGDAGWFLPAELMSLFATLRVPAPANLNRDFVRLQGKGFLLPRRADSRRCLSQTGTKRATDLIGHFHYGQIAAELHGLPGADFADARHSVVPYVMAPARWQPGIANLLKRHPFESNVFCMAWFPKEGHEAAERQTRVIEATRSVARLHGLTLHLANDGQADDTLFGNVGAYMWACNYGIGLLEGHGSEAGQLNDNVLIELGSMLVTGRRCAILKDRGAPQPPSDLSGEIYKSVDFENVDAVSLAVHRWITDDLVLPRCDECPPPIKELTV